MNSAQVNQSVMIHGAPLCCAAPPQLQPLSGRVSPYLAATCASHVWLLHRKKAGMFSAESRKATCAMNTLFGLASLVLLQMAVLAQGTGTAALGGLGGAGRSTRPHRSVPRIVAKVRRGARDTCFFSSFFRSNRFEWIEAHARTALCACTLRW